MAFRHIRSIISEASADQTLYTVPSGKEFILLRTRARYEGGSSSGDGSGDIIASNGTVIFTRVNGAFNRAGTTTVHGVTAPYYSRILDSSTSYYVTRVYSMAHQSVMWIITTYDASGTAENWVEDEGFSAMAYVRSDATSPVGLTFESAHGTPPTFSLGGNSSGGSSVDGNVSVSFKVNSGNAFETIDIDHNAVANGKTWMTLCEAGSVIRANSTNADAMAEIMGIELKAGSWESVGGNGGGGGEPAPGGESSQDYFYVEALENGSTITCENFSSSYGLSSSMDKVTWTTLTGSTVATGVQAGTKVYLRGNTSTLGSNGSPGSGCRFVSDKDFKIGGRVLSLYNGLLNDREPTNDNDLAYWLNCVTGYGSRRVTIAADFRPIRNMYAIFADSWTITAADGLDCSTVVNAHSMFGSCYGLKALPDGFSVPNATDTMYMFSTCYDLLALPDGFSAPNTLSADGMFSECNSLSAIGNNVKVANGAGATGTDNTNINKSQITSIGDNFEWFTNAKFSGTWDPALGIRNVFPNATSVGSGWRVYDHYDGEGSGGSGSGADLDYFYIEPLQDDATVVANGFSSSYRLSLSLDKKTWTALTGGGAIASGVPAGTKMYLRGDTSTLGSTSDGSGCKFYADKAFKTGGSALSLYSPTLEPKELTNENDLAHFFSFYSKEIRECSVDFGPVRSAYCMFYQCAYLSALPDGFSIPNVTNADHMFCDCKNLSSLPAGFSIPNVKNADSMFYNCWSLSSLPEGFSIPNVTFAPDMFYGCYKLSSLPTGFSAPNMTNASMMFRGCSSLSSLPDGFSIPNVTNDDHMFFCPISAIGNNVKVANGAGAASTDSTGMDKSLITSIGDNFEWFTNAVYEGDWDPALGIRNVFPNATSVGSGWRVYNHYDGE